MPRDSAGGLGLSTPPIQMRSSRRSALWLTLVRWTQAVTDFMTFSLSLGIAAGILLAAQGGLEPYFPAEHVRTVTIMHLGLALCSVGWFWVRLRHYTYRKTFWAELGEILRTIAICALIHLIIMALLKLQISRTAWLLTWAITLGIVPIGRFGLKRLLARLNLWHKPCVIIGTGPNALDAYDALSHERSLGFDFRYFYSVENEPTSQIRGIPVLHDEAALWAHTDPEDTHYFIAVEDQREAQRDYWIRQTTVHHCRAVSVIPTTRGLPLNSIDASFIFSHDVLILRIHENLRKRSARIIKRSVDIVVSTALLVLLSPLFAYLMIHIGRDGGQAIYGHERIGRDGRKFKCLKFRSMVTDSKEVLAQILASDPIARAEWEADFKLRNDPRITPIGRFLRRTSLDELPQLWNVLRGEMSLVGPRPIIEAELPRYQGNADYYLMAKPGMTGLWQISGRNDVDYDTRVYFDAWYVKNWSLWHDIAILFRTVNVVLGRTGAY